MTHLRALLLRYPALGLLVVAFALAMKVAMPAGFMPVASAGTITVAVCNGSGPMTIAIPSLPDKPSDDAMKDKPCAFAGLSAPSLAGADPVLLIAAIAFAFLVAIHRSVPAAPQRAARLLPPLRGPPARA